MTSLLREPSLAMDKLTADSAVDLLMQTQTQEADCNGMQSKRSILLPYVSLHCIAVLLKLA